MSRKAIPVLVVLALGLAAPAGAGDGVIEINQARAMAGAINGSLVDDPPGFPVRITQPGSYRLTGDLTVPDGNTTAISVGSVSHVTIDLGGFAILGPNMVGFPGGSCTAGGTGRGIDSVARRAIVRNGHVQGMGRDGVLVSGRIEGLIALNNCGVGLYAGTGGIVVDSIAQLNGYIGIRTDNGAIKNSVALENTGDGIWAAGASTVLGCTIWRNQGLGMAAGNEAGIGHCTFYENGDGAVAGGKNLDCNVIDGMWYCPSHP